MKSHLTRYSIFQKSGAKSQFLENAIDSGIRIKTITYSDVRVSKCGEALVNFDAQRRNLDELWAISGQATDGLSKAILTASMASFVKNLVWFRWHGLLYGTVIKQDAVVSIMRARPAFLGKRAM